VVPRKRPARAFCGAGANLSPGLNPRFGPPCRIVTLGVTQEQNRESVILPKLLICLAIPA
jgi:hypothetical protein